MSSGQEVDTKRIRVDRGFRLLYPQNADSRGSARITIKRKAFYFGEHGSPESYATFALWLADLERAGGSPAKPGVFKADAENFLRQAPRWWTKRPVIASAILLGALLISITTVCTQWIYLSPAPLQVDGVVVTAREIEFVRTARKVGQSIDNQRRARQGEIADIMDNIAKEGIPDAPPPRISAKPPIPPLD